MKSLMAWLPWIIGVLLALVVVRFVAGVAFRIVGLLIVVAVVYFAWRALTGRT